MFRFLIILFSIINIQTSIHATALNKTNSVNSEEQSVEDQVPNDHQRTFTNGHGYQFLNTEELIELAEKSRHKIFDANKLKYHEKHIAKENPPSKREKRALFTNIPPAPTLPPLNFDLSDFMKRMLDDGNSATALPNLPSPTSSSEHIVTPNTYGFNLRGNDGFSWNNLVEPHQSHVIYHSTNKQNEINSEENLINSKTFTKKHDEHVKPEANKKEDKKHNNNEHDLLKLIEAENEQPLSITINTISQESAEVKDSDEKVKEISTETSAEKLSLIAESSDTDNNALHFDKHEQDIKMFARSNMQQDEHNAASHETQYNNGINETDNTSDILFADEINDFFDNPRIDSYNKDIEVKNAIQPDSLEIFHKIFVDGKNIQNNIDENDENMKQDESLDRTNEIDETLEEKMQKSFNNMMNKISEYKQNKNDIGSLENTNGMLIRGVSGYVWNKLSPIGYDYYIGDEKKSGEVKGHKNQIKNYDPPTEVKYNDIIDLRLSNDLPNETTTKIPPVVIKQIYETNNDTNMNSSSQLSNDSIEIVTNQSSSTTTTVKTIDSIDTTEHENPDPYSNEKTESIALQESEGIEPTTDFSITSEPSQESSTAHRTNETYLVPDYGVDEHSTEFSESTENAIEIPHTTNKLNLEFLLQPNLAKHSIEIKSHKSNLVTQEPYSDKPTMNNDSKYDKIQPDSLKILDTVYLDGKDIQNVNTLDEIVKEQNKSHPLQNVELNDTSSVIIFKDESKNDDEKKVINIRSYEVPDEVKNHHNINTQNNNEYLQNINETTTEMGSLEGTHGMDVKDDSGYVWNKIAPNNHEYYIDGIPSDDKCANKAFNFDYLLETTEFWEWFSSWSSSYTEIITETIQRRVSEEIVKQFTEHEFNYINKNMKIGEKKPKKDIDTPENNKNSTIMKVDAHNIYGNTLGSDHVTNIFVFKNLGANITSEEIDSITSEEANKIASDIIDENSNILSPAVGSNTDAAKDPAEDLKNHITEDILTTDETDKKQKETANDSSLFTDLHNTDQIEILKDWGDFDGEQKLINIRSYKVPAEDKKEYGSQAIQYLINEEVEKQLAEVKNNKTNKANKYEEKKSGEVAIKPKVNKTGTSMKVSANSIYGNSLGSDHVRNIFIFYPNTRKIKDHNNFVHKSNAMDDDSKTHRNDADLPKSNINIEDLPTSITAHKSISTGTRIPNRSNNMPYEAASELFEYEKENKKSTTEQANASKEINFDISVNDTLNTLLVRDALPTISTIKPSDDDENMIDLIKFYENDAIQLISVKSRLGSNFVVTSAPEEDVTETDNDSIALVLSTSSKSETTTEVSKETDKDAVLTSTPEEDFTETVTDVIVTSAPQEEVTETDNDSTTLFLSTSEFATTTEVDKETVTDFAVTSAPAGDVTRTDNDSTTLVLLTSEPATTTEVDRETMIDVVATSAPEEDRIESDNDSTSLGVSITNKPGTTTELDKETVTEVVITSAPEENITETDNDSIILLLSTTSEPETTTEVNKETLTNVVVTSAPKDATDNDSTTLVLSTSEPETTTEVNKETEKDVVKLTPKDITEPNNDKTILVLPTTSEPMTTTEVDHNKDTVATVALSAEENITQIYNNTEILNVLPIGHSDAITDTENNEVNLIEVLKQSMIGRNVL